MSGLAILGPLRHRDFRLVAAGSLISLLGDGLFRVAIAFQVLALSGNDARALSGVAAVWAAAQLVTLPVGGWASDRFPRRRIVLGADLWRGLVMGVIAALSLNGELALWHLFGLGALFGAGNGFFNPAVSSLIADLLPESEIGRANAFLGVARPVAVFVVGPLVGGALVSAAGPGAAFLGDAATFAVSAALLALVAAQPAAATGSRSIRDLPRDVAEGFRWIRDQRWAWPLMTGMALGVLAYNGPFEVLVPTLLVTDLNLSQGQAALAMGRILAAGGAGAVLVALVVGQRDLPRRFLSALYVGEGAALLAAVGYGLMTQAWHGVVVGLVVHSLFALTEIVQQTTIQRHVPRPLLGRVSSVDWMTGIGLAPVGLALAGPLGAAFGPRTVLVGSGLLGAASLFALRLVPGALDLQEQAPPPAEPVPAGGVRHAPGPAELPPIGGE